MPGPSRMPASKPSATSAPNTAIPRPPDTCRAALRTPAARPARSAGTQSITAAVSGGTVSAHPSAGGISSAATSSGGVPAADSLRAHLVRRTGLTPSAYRAQSSRHGTVPQTA
jgi:hypothetical protein